MIEGAAVKYFKMSDNLEGNGSENVSIHSNDYHNPRDKEQEQNLNGARVGWKGQGPTLINVENLVAATTRAVMTAMRAINLNAGDERQQQPPSQERNVAPSFSY